MARTRRILRKYSSNQPLLKINLRPKSAKKKPAKQAARKISKGYTGPKTGGVKKLYRYKPGSKL